MRARPIRLLLAHAFPAGSEHIRRALEADPDLHVLGVVGDGQAAIDFVAKRRPDVVLIDVDLPRIDGFEATRRIMEQSPVPIVVCSAESDAQHMAIAFHTIQAGAVACVRRPGNEKDSEFGPAMAELVSTLKLMSEVKVVRRWAGGRREAARLPRPASTRPGRVGFRVVGIGASTGGPPVLQSLLAALPKDFSVPVLVVQHISPGFLQGLIDWLAQTTGLRIVVGSHGARALPGHVYVAPDDFHMGMNDAGHLVLSREPPRHGVRPSVSYLFQSLAEECGPSAVGVLLSGMGKDGAAELKAMRDRGATTIAQDRRTSVVHGMPGEAIALGGATHVLPAGRIAETLLAVVHRRNDEEEAKQ